MAVERGMEVKGVKEEGERKPQGRVRGVVRVVVTVLVDVRMLRGQGVVVVIVGAW